MAPEIPFDVLHRIFEDYASGDDLELLFNLRWTRLLFVCRQWHAVGMSSPRLWSHISFEPSLSISEVPSTDGFAEVEADVRRVRTQLVRAGTWPLTIRYKPLPWTYPEYFQELGTTLFWKPPLVQSLALRGDYLRLNQTLHEICKEPHCNLKSLVLQPCKSELNVSNIITFGECLAQRLPSLQHLNLRDVRCDWSCIRELRSLSLSHAVLMAQPYQLPDITAALRRCPALESLHLELPFWRPIEEYSPALEPLLLPYLAEIHLRGPVHICSPLFLSIATLALGANIDLSFKGVHPRDERNLERVESRIGEHLQRPGAPTIRSLIWGNSAVDGRVAIARTHDPEEACNGSAPNVQFHASTKRPPLGLSVCLASWPLGGVTHLDMRSISVCASGVWRVLLSSLPSLHTVAVRLERLPVEELLFVLDESLTVARRPALNLHLDASDIFSHAFHAQVEERKDRTLQTLNTVLRYCAKAAAAALPLEEVALVDPDRHLIRDDVEWQQYCWHLAVGFRYNGVLHNRADEGLGGLVP
ncbi:hypothetical protein PENSPDRAFT_648652 [Peniophora sp. CONT]|nr:hypothetical protein PENSPDRAFT_648652 [Peniophora sp. CONT]